MTIRGKDERRGKAGLFMRRIVAEVFKERGKRMPSRTKETNSKCPATIREKKSLPSRKRSLGNRSQQQGQRVTKKDQAAGVGRWPKFPRRIGSEKSSKSATFLGRPKYGKERKRRRKIHKPRRGGGEKCGAEARQAGEETAKIAGHEPKGGV